MRGVVRLAGPWPPIRRDEFVQFLLWLPLPTEIDRLPSGSADAASAIRFRICPLPAGTSLAASGRRDRSKIARERARFAGSCLIIGAAQEGMAERVAQTERATWPLTTCATGFTATGRTAMRCVARWPARSHPSLVLTGRSIQAWPRSLIARDAPPLTRHLPSRSRSPAGRLICHHGHCNRPPRRSREGSICSRSTPAPCRYGPPCSRRSIPRWYRQALRFP